MTIETDWDTILRNNFVTWSWVELRWQIVLTACNFSFLFQPFIHLLDVFFGYFVYLDETLLFLFHAQEVCCLLPLFTVLSAFASLLFNLPAVLTHAAPVPWISQDCLVRLHILSALPCLVSTLSTSYLPSLWSSLTPSFLVFSTLFSLLDSDLFIAQHCCCLFHD